MATVVGVSRWHKFTEAFNKFKANIMSVDCQSDREAYKSCGLSEAEIKELEASVEPVQYEDAANIANVGSAGSKKYMNKGGKETQKVQSTRDEKSDDFIR